MIEVTRQRAPFLDGHIAVHQRIELGNGGFGGGTDVIARCHADEIDRAEHAIEHATPKNRRALPHQSLRLNGIIVVDDRLEIFLTLW